MALQGGSSSESGVSVPTGKEKLGVDAMMCVGVGAGAGVGVGADAGVGAGVGVQILIYSVDRHKRNAKLMSKLSMSYCYSNDIL